MSRLGETGGTDLIEGESRGEQGRVRAWRWEGKRGVEDLAEDEAEEDEVEDEQLLRAGVQLQPPLQEVLQERDVCGGGGGGERIVPSAVYS